MKDNGGKVILALLAGASAGIVAGLLMAPETGTATRETWGKSLGKFGDDLSKLLQDGLAKLDALKGGASGSEGDTNTDRSGAEDALAGLGDTGKSSGSKAGGGRKSAAGSGANAGTVDGPDSASTATYSQGSGSSDAGGTTGGSGVGS